MEALKNLLASKKLEGYLVINEKNMQYFTGFSGGSMLLIPMEGESILYVYGVNYEAAKEETENATVELIKAEEDFAKKVADEIRCLKLSHVGFDSLRASSYLKMKKLLQETELEPAGEIVWSLRKVKDETELALIKRAAELTSRGMRKASEILSAGLKEREVAAEIEYEMRKSGSNGVAFDTIVAKYRDYCADLTRTFIIGKASPRQAKVYETVREAQSIAVNQIRAGIEAKEVDKAAREHISKKGYGEYFVHSLGHGVGLDIHEPPTLGPTSKDVLAYGNVVTVEPGVYIPRFGGVRIEDTVIVLNDQARKITDAP